MHKTAIAQPSVTVPFEIKQIDGKRPVIAVKVNGHPFHMVIHSNAGFFMQIHHALAGKVGVANARHVGAFGIESKGRLSSLGRDEARVEKLSIGSATFTDLPVSVFETPGDQDSGMLGLDWIRSNRVIMNYANSTVTANPTSAAVAATRTALLARGYVAIPMERDASTKRYFVHARIGAALKRMDVSTVAETILDTDFAKEAGIETGRVIGTYGGPQGATGQVYATGKAITITLGEWRSGPIDDAIVQDAYAYASQKRPASGAIGGQLAADVMIANGAVIDFGNQTLYLRRLS